MSGEEQVEELTQVVQQEEEEEEEGQEEVVHHESIVQDDGGVGELLQQFQTEDGETIVLSSEQIAQMQQGMQEQHFVEEIIGTGDSSQEGDMTQQIHIDADGNAHIITNQMHDLVTFHSGEGGEEGGYVEEQEVHHMQDDGQQMELEHHQQMVDDDQLMEADNVVEEVIAQTGHHEEVEEGDYLGGEMEVGGEEGFINFNADTGTFDGTQQQQQGQKVIRRVMPKGEGQQQVKYVLQAGGADGQGQQIVLDANSFHGLIQGGALTVDGSTGKQIIMQQQQSPSKKTILQSSRSPAKILPAPVPIGDQQQGTSSSSGGRKIVYMQGNQILTSLPSGQKLIATGSGNQLQFVRVVQKAPANKVPIAPVNLKPRPTLAPKPGPSDIQNTTGLGNVVVLPNYLLQKDQQRSSESSVLTDSNSLLSGLGSSSNLDSFRSLLEPNGMRPRKPCNCTKSQCLKLYCDCFANGEFCHLCNCTNCFNNLNHEEDRQKAIKLVLERNPGAFRPKIGKSSMTGEAHERRHNKGCNCRRSGCLKNYCECYEAKIFCSGICKCTGCKNCIENIPSGLPNGVGVEQHFAGAGTAHRQTLKDLAEAAEVRVQQQNQVRNKMRAQMQEVSPQNNLGIMVPPIVFRYPHGSISYEVITSTVELLLSKAEAGEKQKLSEGEIERLVLEEFSECLASIMDLGTSIDRHWP